MRELIEQLDTRLATTRPAYYACLLPGVSDSALDDFAARFSLSLPSAFRELYRWRDGQRDDCREPLHGNWMLSPLARVAEYKEMLDGMIGEDFEDPDWWLPQWIPFLDNAGGDHLCLDTASGQLVQFWHDWEQRRVVYSDLEAWLTAVVASLT